MTDSTTPDTKPGPPNPQAAGADAASPPGGPLRQDRPSHEVPPGHHDGASANRAATKHAEDAGGHTIPLESEQPDASTDSDEDDVQEENAETSLDQPSEG